MSKSLEEQYIAWLWGLIGEGPLTGESRLLIDVLHEKDFYWTVPNDDNRGNDGLLIREEFADLKGVGPEDILEGPCTLLEMLVGLARRCSDEMADPDHPDTTKRWFWEMMDNLGLENKPPYLYEAEFTSDVIEFIFDRVLDRTYAPSGRNGLFPLNYPKEDQRKVELWYQMSAYLLEHYAL